MELDIEGKDTAVETTKIKRSSLLNLLNFAKRFVVSIEQVKVIIRLLYHLNPVKVIFQVMEDLVYSVKIVINKVVVKVNV